MDMDFSFRFIINMCIATIYSPVVIGYISDVKYCDQNMTAIVESDRNFTSNISILEQFEHHFEIAYFDEQHMYSHLCLCYQRSCFCFYPRFTVTQHEASNTSFFTIDTVSPSDSTIYIVSDRFSRWARCIYLHVVEAKVYPDTLKGYIEEGDSILFNVTNPSVNYKSSSSWKIGNEALIPWPHIVTENSLEIKQVTRRLDKVNISYTVFEHNNSTNSTFTLNVAYGPDNLLPIMPDITFYHVRVGENLGAVTCNAECNPRCERTWETFGKPVSIVDSQLLLEYIKPTFDGEYRCIARRNGSSIFAARSLYIVVKEIRVEFRPTRSVYEARLGEIIPPIICEANCLTICKMKWIKMEDQTVTNDSTLTIGPVTSEHTGEYICVAEIDGSTVKAERSLLIFIKDEENSTLIILLVIGFAFCLLGLIVVIVFTVRHSARNCSMLREKFGKKEDVKTNPSETSERSGPVTSIIYSDLQREDQDEKNKYEDLNNDSREENYANV